MKHYRTRNSLYIVDHARMAFRRESSRLTQLDPYAAWTHFEDIYAAPGGGPLMIQVEDQRFIRTTPVLSITDG